MHRRWPWKLFLLLAEKPETVDARRRQTAEELLSEPDAKLEATTRKLRKRCRQELECVAATGQLKAGTCLHAVLLLTALRLPLDSGSLESLNSMIKSCMSSANNSGMTLELLSSRVNMRKTLTLETGGSMKLKDVRPAAEALARTSVIYQRCEKAVRNTELRWQAPEPRALVPSDPGKHSPHLLLSAVQHWAVKFNRMLLKKLHSWRKSADCDGLLVALLFEEVPRGESATQHHPDMYLFAEVCGRTAWMLCLRRRPNEDAGFTFLTSGAFEFSSSLDAIAQQQRLTEGGLKRRMSLAVVSAEVKAAGDGRPNGILEFCTKQTLHVADLGKRRERRAAEAKPDSEAGEAEPLQALGNVDSDESEGELDLDEEAFNLTGNGEGWLGVML